MARNFNGTTDQILLSMSAALAVVNSGAVFAVVKRANNTGWHGPVSRRSSGADDETYLDIAPSGSSNSLFSNFAAGASGLTVTAAEGWVIVGATKAAGSSTVRHHKYVFGTSTWSHLNTSAVGDAVGTTGGSVMIGNVGGDRFSGDIDVAAFFSAALSDVQVETLDDSLTAWDTLTPVAMWVLNQASTATAVTDRTGGGADQTALTGTTVSTGSPLTVTSANVTVTPGAVALTLAVPAATVTRSTRPTPAAVALTLATPAATVATTGNATVTPAAVPLALAVPPGTVNTGVTVPGRVSVRQSKSFPFADGNAGHACALDAATLAGNAIVIFVNSDTTVSNPTGFGAPKATFVTQQGAYAWGKVSAGETSVTIVTSGNFATVVTIVELATTDTSDPFLDGDQANSSSVDSNTSSSVTTSPAGAGRAVLAAAVLANGGSAASQAVSSTWTGGLSHLLAATVQGDIEQVVGFLDSTVDAADVTTAASILPGGFTYLHVGTLAVALKPALVAAVDATAAPTAVPLALAVPAASVVSGTGASVSPAAVPLTLTLPPLLGTASTAVTADAAAVGLATPAPTVLTSPAQLDATVTPSPVVLGLTVQPATLSDGSARPLPGAVLLRLAVPRPVISGAFVVGSRTVPDARYIWLGQRTTGASTADRERTYYAALSGLAATRSISDHKRAYFITQLGLSGAAGAARSLTSLEMAFWESVDPGNNTGSYQDRARRFYGA